MSPEEIATPESVAAKSDLYSLGAVGYYLLCGAPVFGGANVIEVCGHHLHTPPPPLAARASQPVPADLERVIMECLAKPPEARPESAQVLAERLRACVDSSAWSEGDARAWWEKHGVRGAPASDRDHSGDSRLLPVDLETRRSAATPRELAP
jgi:serine/threonine-protein kinase